MNVRGSCTKVRRLKAQSRQADGGAFFLKIPSLSTLKLRPYPPPTQPFPPSFCLPPTPTATPTIPSQPGHRPIAFEAGNRLGGSAHWLGNL